LLIPKLTFNKKQKEKWQKTLLFEGALQCNNGLVSNPQTAENRGRPILTKAYFLKDSQDISLIPDKYV